MWQNRRGKPPSQTDYEMKGEKTRCGFTDMSEPRDSSSHNLCLFIHVHFLASYFLCAPLSFLFVCSLSSVPSVSPSPSPVMPQMAFVKDGEITEDFYLSDPAVPFIFLSQLDLSHTSASYCCLAAGSRPRARLVLSQLLSSLPWASAGKNSTPWICIFSVLHCCGVRLHLRARIHPDIVCNIDAPGRSTGYLWNRCRISKGKTTRFHLLLRWNRVVCFPVFFNFLLWTPCVLNPPAV